MGRDHRLDFRTTKAEEEKIREILTHIQWNRSDLGHAALRLLFTAFDLQLLGKKIDE